MTETLEEFFRMRGQDLGAGDWVEMTQERVDMFADASEDHQWIHVDPDRAKDGPYGGTIAHGFLTLSLVLWLGRGLSPRPPDTKMAVNYGLNKVRFPSAVPVGKRVRAHVKNVGIEQISEGVVHVTNQFSVEVEGGTKPACVAEIIARFTF
jgi:acyl dehydratase